jgi:hypothetical protein
VGIGSLGRKDTGIPHRGAPRLEEDHQPGPREGAENGGGGSSASDSRGDACRQLRAHPCRSSSCISPVLYTTTPCTDCSRLLSCRQLQIALTHGSDLTHTIHIYCICPHTFLLCSVLFVFSSFNFFPSPLSYPHNPHPPLLQLTVCPMFCSLHTLHYASTCLNAQSKFPCLFSLCTMNLIWRRRCLRLVYHLVAWLGSVLLDT